MTRPLSQLKLFFVPKGRAPRTIQSGIFQGIRMELNLQHQTQYYLGLHERELYPWVQRFSKDIRAAVDIGVGEGEYAVYFLTKTPAEVVLAFEPNEACQAQTASNLILNRLSNHPRLKLLRKFLGSFDKNDTCTLDSYASLISSPCLIKMDVDGGELQVLRGARQILHMPDVRWIIETHTERLEEQCARVLSQAGYAVTIIPNAWWRIFIPEMRISQRGNFNRWLVATGHRDSQP